MNTKNTKPNRGNVSKAAKRPVTGRLHPRVYALLIAVALWFVLSVWSFAGGGVSDYLLFIVSGFIFIAVALPLILSRVAHTNNAAKGDDNQPSLRDWAKWDFDTWAGRLSGAQAAAQILLPIAAAAFGMTVIGIAFHIAEHGGV